MEKTTEFTLGDFRIGNLVYDETRYFPRRITSLTRPNVYAYEDDDKFEDGFLIGGIKPIAINEEWLQKLGFIKTPKSDWGLKIFGVSMSLIYNSHKNLILRANAIPSEFTIFVECKYVHQIQNLHFTLTGTEIEIKEIEPKKYYAPMDLFNGSIKKGTEYVSHGDSAYRPIHMEGSFLLPKEIVESWGVEERITEKVKEKEWNGIGKPSFSGSSFRDDVRNLFGVNNNNYPFNDLLPNIYLGNHPCLGREHKKHVVGYDSLKWTDLKNGSYYTTKSDLSNDTNTYVFKQGCKLWMNLGTVNRIQNTDGNFTPENGFTKFNPATQQEIDKLNNI
jgi:hypothetical protein